MIYIIVPTFAKVDQTIKFLDSIKNSVENNYLIILIDDHPKNLTFNNIQQNEFIRIIPSKKELWWVGSINLGIQIIFREYKLNDDDIVVFANNDVQIEKKSFDVLKFEIQNNSSQIVHPRTFDQNNFEVSSGAKIHSTFPYITTHPKGFKSKRKKIDMGTARFLMMCGITLKKVGFINQELIQYGGDNDFTMAANRFHNIETYILRDAYCKLDDTVTGIKNHNIKNMKELSNSFFSIKSPNNFKYRYRLFKKFYGKFRAFFITLSLSINTILKFFLNKILK